jgi:hypothetical protein
MYVYIYVCVCVCMYVCSSALSFYASGPRLWSCTSLWEFTKSVRPEVFTAVKILIVVFLLWSRIVFKIISNVSEKHITSIFRVPKDTRHHNPEDYTQTSYQCSFSSVFFHVNASDPPSVFVFKTPVLCQQPNAFCVFDAIDRCGVEAAAQRTERGYIFITG